MAKTKISEWSSTPANNTDIDSINIAEGCAPSGINDAIRELMSQVKDLYSGTTGDAIGIAGGGTGQVTATAAFNALAPSQTSNSGKYLTTDGTNSSWATVATTSAATPTALGTVYGKTDSSSLAFLGYQAGNSNTGASNVAVGYRSLYSNTSAAYNTAVGATALYSNTTGAFNVASGFQSLYFNTTGANNVSVGKNSLVLNTTGSNNVAVGTDALYSNTTAAGNSAVGDSALRYNTTGASNNAFGNNALNGNTTGDFNCAFGPALVLNTTGANNVAMGYQALLNNITGQNCTAVGYRTLYNQTGIGYNSALGFEALKNVTSGTNNLGLGYNGGADAGVVNITTQSNYIGMGNASITNAYIAVAWTVTSDARNKTEINPVPHGLNFVNQLNPVSFRFKKSRQDDTPIGDVRYGFLAQDILALEGSDSVVIDAKDADNLKYTDQNMTAILVKAIQELKAEFDAYKATHP